MGTTTFMLPLGETVTEGTTLESSKQVGDTIAEGEVFVESSTDKVETDVHPPVRGKILESWDWEQELA